jgi:hypothetical protein
MERQVAGGRWQIVCFVNFEKNLVNFVVKKEVSESTKQLADCRWL